MLPSARCAGGHDFDAAPASTHALRSIHEWCCSPISLISSGCASDARGCLCQRTTESEDGTTLSAVKRARCFLSRANSLLWSSMPCTGVLPGNVSTSKSQVGMQGSENIYDYLTNYGTGSKLSHDILIKKGTSLPLSGLKDVRIGNFPKYANSSRTLTSSSYTLMGAC